MKKKNLFFFQNKNFYPHFNNSLEDANFILWAQMNFIRWEYHSYWDYHPVEYHYLFLEQVFYEETFKTNFYLFFYLSFDLTVNNIAQYNDLLNVFQHAKLFFTFLENQNHFQISFQFHLRISFFKNLNIDADDSQPMLFNAAVQLRN